jgi:hypothetical protein
MTRKDGVNLEGGRTGPCRVLGLAKVQSDEVRPAWRLVKGDRRLFLSSRFGYAHELPRFIEELKDFRATFYRARLAAKGPKRHDVTGECEQPFSKQNPTES